jgi:phage shock protein PspC (stress-responsive transcriptional regulator)
VIHSCNAFSDCVSQALAGNGPLPPEEVALARTCARCSHTITLLTQALAEPPSELPLPRTEAEAQTTARAQGTARRAWKLSSLLRALTGLGVGTYTLWIGQWFALFSAPIETRPFLRALVASAATIWLITLGFVARQRPGRSSHLFLDWQGRQLQGLCSGIAKYFGVQVWLVRALFLLLVVGDLGGLTIYFAASFGLTFDPNEREHLWSFRARRFFARHFRRNDM